MSSTIPSKAIGRAWLVTGSTDGIGLHTAKRLASSGCTVLVHGRSKERVTNSVADVKRVGQHDRVYGFTHDLSTLAGVRSLAADVTGWLDGPTGGGGKLDLINNAGVFENKLKTTADGYEMTWAVNVLAPFLLTSLLLDRVQQRIINVASISAGSSFDFSNLNQEKGFSGHNAYSLSKLASIAFTLALADKVKDRGIKVNTLDPGTVDTKMLSAGWGCGGIPIAKADYQFRLATDPAVADVTGAYFVSHRKTNPPAAARDVKTQARLWQLWQDQTQAVWPDSMSV